MKKIGKLIVTILFLNLLIGCNLANTPTSQVEDFLSNYQMLNKKIKIDEKDLLPDEQLSKDLKVEYQKLIKKQYQNLSYSVKDEKIDGNKATVEVEVTVLNYKKEIDTLEDNKNLDYSKTLLKKLKKTKEKITYTINFKTKKDKDGNWKVQTLDKEDRKKLLGIYSN